MHFPGFPVSTCEFLCLERKVGCIGVDTISFDPGYDKEYRSHKEVFRHGVLGIECINGLSEMPGSGGMVFAGGLKVKGASGSPIRLIGMF